MAEAAHCDGRLESVLGALDAAAHVHHAGVAGEPVEAVVVGGERGGELADRLEVGEVESHDLVRSAEADEALGRLLAGLGPAAGHDHVACLLDELTGSLEADAGVRAGDDVGPAGEVLRAGRLVDREPLSRHGDPLPARR